MIKLSIIIPIYNAEKYLKDCLDSFAEADENVEIIMIDDGSTDSSADIVQSYVGKHNITLIRKENGGVSSARNIGLNNSHGEWVMFVDADDILSKGWYSTIIDAQKDNSDIIYFASQYDGKTVYTKEYLIKCCLNYCSNSLYLATPFSKIYRRKFLVDNGLVFDEKLINGEDMLFNVEAIVKAGSIGMKNRNIYKYRVNNQSSTKRYNPRFEESDRVFQYKLNELLSSTDALVIEDRKHIMTSIYQNGCVELIRRLTYLGSYSAFVKACKAHSELKFDIKGTKSKINRVILFLFKLRCYGLIYGIFTYFSVRLTKAGSYFLSI